MAKSEFQIKLPKDDFSKSIAGFIAALIVGALIPRTVAYLFRRVLLRSFREIFVLAAAGWLTDRIAQTLVRDKSEKK